MCEREVIAPVCVRKNFNLMRRARCISFSRCFGCDKFEIGKSIVNLKFDVQYCIIFIGLNTAILHACWALAVRHPANNPCSLLLNLAGWMSTQSPINELCNIHIYAPSTRQLGAINFSFCDDLENEKRRNQWTSTLTALLPFIKAHSGRLSMSGALIVFETFFPTLLHAFTSFNLALVLSSDCANLERCPLNASRKVFSIIPTLENSFTAFCVFPFHSTAGRPEKHERGEI